MINTSFIYQRPRLPQIIARSVQTSGDRRWRIPEGRRVMACTSSEAGISLFDEVNWISDTVDNQRSRGAKIVGFGSFYLKPD
jgi:hypothetical protein